MRSFCYREASRRWREQEQGQEQAPRQEGAPPGNPDLGPGLLHQQQQDLGSLQALPRYQDVHQPLHCTMAVSACVLEAGDEVGVSVVLWEAPQQAPAAHGTSSASSSTDRMMPQQQQQPFPYTTAGTSVSAAASARVEVRVRCYRSLDAFGEQPYVSATRLACHGPHDGSPCKADGCAGSTCASSPSPSPQPTGLRWCHEGTVQLPDAANLPVRQRPASRATAADGVASPLPGRTGSPLDGRAAPPPASSPGL